jgi:hypothetical protein
MTRAIDHDFLSRLGVEEDHVCMCTVWEEETPSDNVLSTQEKGMINRTWTIRKTNEEFIQISDSSARFPRKNQAVGGQSTTEAQHVRSSSSVKQLLDEASFWTGFLSGDSQSVLNRLRFSFLAYKAVQSINQSIYLSIYVCVCVDR